jgi:hypothetical protein
VKTIRSKKLLLPLHTITNNFSRSYELLNPEYIFIPADPITLKTIYRMKKHLYFFFIPLIIFSSNLKAQEVTGNEWRPESFSMGPGVGLDYGGLGVQMIAYPQKNVGLFFGGGYALAGFGYNVGVKLRGQRVGAAVDPFFMGMYGYNAAVYGQGDKDLNQIFYGPSLGLGVDLHRRRNSLGYWSFALIVPFRSSEAVDWAHSHGYAFSPVDVSVGYKFMFP